MLAVRFLADRDGGLSSGVRGVLDLPEGLDARRRERVDTFEDGRRLMSLFVVCAAIDPLE